MDMARFDYEDQNASFMIFYNGEFSSNLRIPTKFATKYRHVVNQASVMLETADSEECWEVKIKNINGHYYIKDGWLDFMKDSQIHDTDFVTFRLVSQSTFEVTIYRNHGCTRVLTSPTTSDVNKRARGRGRGRGRGRPPTCKRKRSNPLYFEICLKEYQQSRISLPKKFTDAAGMKRKRNVRMEYEGVGAPKHNNKWNVVVDHMPHCYRTDLARGWCRFRKVNKLVYGKVYSFEFIPNKNVIHVEEVK